MLLAVLAGSYGAAPAPVVWAAALLLAAGAAGGISWFFVADKALYTAKERGRNQVDAQGR
ncbi:MAG TPA: hypothetical protein ENN98_02400 [Desulfurivibrio alkaliphilus]|uniref:Uncharacterized protein n=1 Tax=Desulfurivibrio alkaliphilus TaxID=427923 RepID=A0A7C2XLY7_9BACT|nr:hypothetical protein [Desulfurivibrio alkaliphilus]